jgi:type II secretory pathway component PulL
MHKIKNSRFVQNLKRQAEENPVVVLMAAAAVITASAKLVDAIGHNAGSRAYAKQVAAKLKKG